jgi:hypothetical protein
MRRAISVAVALLLLTTAMLKLSDLFASSTSGEWWTDLRVKLLTIQWEFVLGVWLLSGYRPLAAWVVAVVTFLGFAVLSGYLGIVGVPSCGCFGATAKTSPWLSFGIDVIVIMLLIRYRAPGLDSLQQWRNEFAGTVPVAAAACVLTVAGLILLARQPVSDQFLAKVRGDTLTARPALVDVGEGVAGEVREGTLEISNWSDRPLRVFGGTSGCNYDILVDCPRTIAAKVTDSLRVKYRLSDDAGRSKVKVQLWAIHDDDPPIPIRFELGGTTKTTSP